MSDLLHYFDELCDLNVNDREARLLAISASDAELAVKLRAMLLADGKGTELIAHDISLQPVLGASVFKQSASGSHIAPADFGNYHMLRELGAGGMGLVWLAERSLGKSTQLVAIKFVRQAGNLALLKHFDREREALARLEHPSIARLIDAGVSTDGTPYLATEYVDGESVLDYVRSHQLDLPARLRLIEDLCEAVDYAHRRLLVHRDIKPSNVMVDRAGRVRLLDFGIAKVLDVGSIERTQNNPMSPAYAAPEQAMGEPISTATDVFGLGLLLYELLTGQLPIQRRSSNPFDLAKRLSGESIAAPSLADGSETTELDSRVAARDWPKQLRGDLDLIVLKALKREPERRYASALALAEDLRRFREGRAIAARPDSGWYRVRKMVLRNQALSALSVLSLLAIMGLSIAALLYAERAQKQSLIALSEARNAQQAVEQTNAVNDFFNARLGEGRITEQAQGAQLLHKDWVLNALPKLDTELANAPKARALLRRQFGVALRDLGEQDKSRSTLELAVQEATDAFGDSIETANSLAALASIQRDAANVFARANIDEAISMFDRLPANDTVRAERLSARTTLLRIQTAGGDYAGALETAKFNITERSELFGVESPRLAVDYNNLSALLNRSGLLEAAEQANDRAMVLIRATPNPPLARIALLERSSCLLARGRARYEKALAACARARELFASSVGKNHRETADIDMLESSIHLDKGEFLRAKALLSSKIEIDEFKDKNLQRIRLAVYENNWRQVQVISQATVLTGEAVDRMIRCYMLLANWMMESTDSNLGELRDAVEQMQSQNDLQDRYRAQANAAFYLALIANSQEAESAAQKAMAILFLRKNMDEPAAEKLWANWIASNQ